MSFSGLAATTHSNTLTKRSHHHNESIFGWFFGLSVAASLWMIGRWWWEHHVLHKKREQRNNDNNKKNQNHTSSSSSSLSASTSRSLDHNRSSGSELSSSSSATPDLGQAFEEAASKIRKAHLDHLSNEDKLLLYALYKQTTQGDAPNMLLSLSMTDHAKHSTWSHLRGMPKEVAALKYIELSLELLQSEGKVGTQSSSLETLGAGVASRPVLDDGGVAAKSKEDMTPQELLLVAAGEDDVETVRVLVEHGEHGAAVSVTYADDEGQTALHIAADAGALHTLQVLLQHGGDACAADKYGISVLQAAVIAGHVPVCQLLLEHGADPDQKDQDGDTPRNCAVDDGGKEMRALFSVRDAAIQENDEEEED